jgi:acid phosphatase (class A)
MHRAHFILLLALPLLATGAAARQDLSKLPPHYLAAADLPDSLALLPPPPAPDSAAFARDEEVSKAMARPVGSARFAQAASDADLEPGHALKTFTCALGFAPDPKGTPTLYRLLGKAMVDIGLSTYKAKNHYQRVRPFVAHGNVSCYPPDEAALRKDGSYPSGHSALGWGWALLLAEIAPHHADAILQRGRDFGQSRLVCNVHWASDVDAGRLIASAAVARLHADPEFRKDLQQAKAEAMVAPRAVNASCAAEAAALAQ